MHYYKRNIGDYAAATGHLTLIEHGIYTLLMDWCYGNEHPITTEKAIRIARGNQTETESVLSEFFIETENGWIHPRIQRELDAYHERSATNRENGKRGGRPTKTQSVSKNNPNHKPLTINQEKALEHANACLSAEPTSEPLRLEPPSKAGPPPCPVDEIVKIYMEVLPELPGVRMLTDARRKHIQQRWREDPERQNLEWWRGYFRYVRECPLLMGKVDRPNGNAPWQASLDWLVNPNNMAKVIEGNYQPTGGRS